MSRTLSSLPLERKRRVTVEPSKESLSECSIVDNAPPRRAGWLLVCAFMVADVMGVGIMSIANAFAGLGWAMGVVFCVAFLFINIYCGILLWEAQEHFVGHNLSLQSMARHIYGWKTQWFTAAVVYSYIIFMLGSYVLTLGQTLQMAFEASNFGSELCMEGWAALAMLPLVPMTQVRTLTEAGWLLILNVFTLTGTVVLAAAAAIEQGVQETRLSSTSITGLVAPDLSLDSFSSSLSAFAFAYVGTFLYLEMMSEMKTTADFPKTFLVTGPYQLAMYMLVGVVGYQYFGSEVNGLFISNLDKNSWAYIPCAVLLYLHIVLTYIMKATVMARVFQSKLHPKMVDDYSLRGKLDWFLVTMMLLICCYLIAVLVPDFSALTDLLGALQTPIFGFILPILFSRNARRALGKRTGISEIILQVIIVLLSAFLLIFGTMASIRAIIATYEARTPFATCSV